MTGLFITGTDTGVGKTYITAAIARLLRRQGHPVRVCKPVATGARLVQGRWLCDDTILLAEATGQAWDDVTRWTFPDPVAPPVAALRQGLSLSLPEIVGAVRQRGRAGVPLLVEGVGGLLCPLTDKETVADLAGALGLPLLVTARRSLGTLNHTLLTLEVARGRSLAVAGVVVNEAEPADGLAAETNVEELRRRIDVPLLAVVTHQRGEGLEAVDWRRICQ